jgi:hypothetical protein
VCTASAHSLRAQQDENMPPASTAAPHAASGSVSCTAGALLQPQPLDQLQGTSAAAAAQPKGPAGKPQLKRRQAPRAQQPWGSFKAPRMQHSSVTASSKLGSSIEADTDPSAAVDEPPDPETAQQQQHAHEAEQRQQQDSACCDAVVPAEAVEAAPGSGSEAFAAAAVQEQQGAPAVPVVARFGLRKSLKGGAGRQAFQPPFRR